MGSSAGIRIGGQIATTIRGFKPWGKGRFSERPEFDDPIREMEEIKSHILGIADELNVDYDMNEWADDLKFVASEIDRRTELRERIARLTPGKDMTASSSKPDPRPQELQ